MKRNQMLMLCCILATSAILASCIPVSTTQSLEDIEYTNPLELDPTLVNVVDVPRAIRRNSGIGQQITVHHVTFYSSAGFFNHDFPTFGESAGDRLNFFFRNDGSHSNVAKIQERSGDRWVDVGYTMTVLPGREQTIQISNISLNAEHRVRIVSPEGASVAGMVAARQTSNSLY